MALSVIGALLFASCFLTFALNFGNFGGNVEQGMKSGFLRAVIGFGFLGVGQFLMRVGRWGAAGSGIILDPEQTREDVEPWARMAGGVVKDALEEAHIAPNPHLHADLLPFDEQLRRLHKLREEGLISEDEYQDKKQQILDEI